MEQVTVGVIGCGVISEIYLKNLTTRFAGVRVKSCADHFREKSEERARQFGIQAVAPDQLLADPNIQVVLNLTNPASHAEMSLAALRAGKHVYSEKPLALSLADAKRILAEAEERGLRVGCAPDTFLGAGLQTGLKAVADGWIGRPLAAAAFFTCRGHERWHPNPAFYYQPGGGPQLDMGPYYITALVAALGGVRRVSALSGAAFPERVFGAGPNRGGTFPVEIDTHYSASLEFVSGAIATVMFSFDVWAANLPRLEIYGTGGSVFLPDPNFFAGPVRAKCLGADDAAELPLQSTFTENLRGIGLAQMCKTIRDGGDHLANGRLAAHVLDVLTGMETSAKRGAAVECGTACEKPPLLPGSLTEVEYGF